MEREPNDGQVGWLRQGAFVMPHTHSLLSDWRLITAALVVGKGFSSLHAPGFKKNYLDMVSQSGT